ncbi:MAG TPA: carboxylate-amine ligase [Steroidobacteraceae bacterium]|nr:carboxylate-amine ligase [Steroidobacteraceae bacterium]
MSLREPPFTVGIEEEYLLVDLDSYDLSRPPPPELLRECFERGGGQISPEFPRPQIEVATRVCRTMSEVRADLAELRAIVVEVSRKYGLAPIAAATHPFASASAPRRGESERLVQLASEIRADPRRMLICSMHVHVGIDADDLRVDLMNQYSYFLPHLLALSCSSPFWEGEETGFKSFRLTILSTLPRTGLPERFASFDDFRRQLDMLIASGLIEDTTRIWWDVRPNARYPTLETRITDCCTDIDDAVCIAALKASLLRMLFRLRQANRSWRLFPNTLLAENRWRAIRYGYDEKLLDLAKGELVSFEILLGELLELVREDAEALDCVREVEHARTILRRGTSAHLQLAACADARSRGASPREALRAVVAFLVRQTAAGIGASRA